MPKVSLVQWQNRYAVLERMQVRGASEASYSGLQLNLKSEPAALLPQTWHIDALPADGVIAIDANKVDLSHSFLQQLTEATRVRVTLRLVDRSGSEIAQTSAETEALAANQWGGCHYAPELLAAFVQPNDAAVSILVKRAVDWLQQHHPLSSAQGYKGGAENVWHIVEAAWQALAGERLGYAPPPPNFELSGQKIRPSRQVLNDGLATCLDSTVLLASVLEAMGLSTVVVFSDGHANLAVWLLDKKMDQLITKDLASLRSKVFLPRELLVVETTLLSGSTATSLSYAVERAEGALKLMADETFRGALCITCARDRGIRPMTEAKADGVAAGSAAPSSAKLYADETAAERGDQPAWLSNVQAGTTAPAVVKEQPTSKGQRLAAWKAELLDLTLNNALLNMKDNKKTLSIVVPDVAALEDALASGKRYRLQPLPELMPKGKHTLAPEELRALEDAAARKALEHGDLYVRTPANALDATLTALYRLERTLEQEGDANTLHLAIGSLRWRHEHEHTSHMAPLILLPLQLERKSVSAPYYLSSKGPDEARLNPTLLELLRQDFELQIPLPADDLPRDEAGLDVPTILRAVGLAVRDQPGWEVIDDCRMAIFSFTRYLLWRDLGEHAGMLEQNSVVKHLLNCPTEPFVLEKPFPEAHRLDTLLSAEQTVTPFPADSSQLVAIRAAADGTNLVVIGPPGTGKSQTIANIIAQSLAAKKKVLFVSAKAEALNVVYHRLQQRGLGELCLSMHQHDGGKGAFIDQMRAAWARTAPADDRRWQLELARVATTRQRLNTYAADLHARAKNGLTPYRAMGQVLMGAKSPQVVLHFTDLDAHDEPERLRLADLASKLGLAARDADGLHTTSLSWVTHQAYTPIWQDALAAAARDAQRAGTSLTTLVDAARGCLPKLSQSPSIGQLKAVVALCRQALDARDELALLSERPLQATLTQLDAGQAALVALKSARAALPIPWPEADCRNLRAATLDVVALQKARAALVPNYPEVAKEAGRAPGQALVKATHSLDPAGLTALWRAAQGRIWPLSWWAKRRVRLRLNAFRSMPITSAQVPQELAALVELEDLGRRVLAYTPAPAQEELWRSAETAPELISAALAFQEQLAGAQISNEAVAPVLAGRCGRELLRAYEAAQAAHKANEAFAAVINAAGLHNLPEAVWRGENTELAALGRRLDAGRKLVGLVDALPVAGIAGPELWLQDLGTVLHPSRSAHAEAVQAVSALVHGAASLLAPLEHYLLQIGATGVPTAGHPGASIGATTAHAENLLPLIPKLKLWCAWLRIKQEATQAGLEPLVEAIESGALAPEQAEQAFGPAYAAWWLKGAISRTPALNDFVPSAHENTAANFHEADDYLSDHCAERIRHSLHALLPDREAVGSRTDWGKLNHELNKKRRFITMRKLLEITGTAVQELMPCFMMSPLSVAQYLPLKANLFDIVIFDEASQIRCSEAIGAMARGKQIIMVGDPKQMPPTNFFGRVADSDEEASDDEPQVENLESVLDLCLAARLPKHSLKWHYRSRHESLIAFSNHVYYDGELVTFCSPDHKTRAITYHRVPDGLWLKGTARRNEAEAKALVADIVAKIEDGTFERQKYTVGVIAFNLNQARYIEDLLDQQAQTNVAVNEATSERGYLNLFVKNLESVQGDERDIIYFSVGYAATEPGGKVPLRFGPLNQEGGERRLNVALTRARCQMHVFCSFHDKDLHTDRLKGRGAKDLGRFLTYASDGGLPITAAANTSKDDFESPFEQHVADRLRALGWQVDTQIGAGSFRIDLGILDPGAPGRYLAGIECDGATYHRSATARDRDKLRQAALEGLGWRIIRVWSTDFWHDADVAIARINTDLRKLTTNSPPASGSIEATTPAQHLPTTGLEVPPMVVKTPFV